MAVRQDRLISVHGCTGQLIAVRNNSLAPAVGDLLTAIIYRQTFDLGRPVVFFRQCNDGTIGQGHIKRSRTDPVLVIRVVPDFLYAEAHFLSFIAVGHGRDSPIDFGLCQGITGRHIPFRPGVRNFLTVRIFRQICHCGSPVVGSTQRYFNSAGQRHGQAFRTFAVLVTRVIPDLHDRRFRFHRRMAVRQRSQSIFNTCTGQFIACRRFAFGPGVADLRSVILIHRKIFDDCGPAVRVGQRNFCPVGECHGQRCGTDPVLVIAVIPDLPDFRFGQFRRMAVGDGRDRTIDGGIRQCITCRQSAFRPDVCNFLTVRVLRQTGDCGSPAVRLIERKFRSVGQCHGQAFRTYAVLVIRVIPDLHDRRFRFLRCMAVRQRSQSIFNTCTGQFIACRRFAFGPGVADLRSVILIHRKIFDDCGPAVRVGQRNFCPVGECHGQRCGTDPVLVIAVIPDLPDFRFGQFRRMAVGDGRDRTIDGGIRQCITCRQSAFRPDVCNFLTVRVLRQTGDCGSPAVRLIERKFRSVGQCHGQAFRTYAVLVIRVIPDLHDRRFRFLRRMAVRKRSHGICCTCTGQFIALHFAFCPGVYNFFTRRVLRQIFNHCSPAVRFIERYIRSVGQCHGQACRPLAVLVIRVIPDLFDSRRSEFRRVCIRYSEAVDRGHVTADLIFRDGVADFCTVVAVFRQTAEGHAPSGSGISRQAADRVFAAVKQVDRHAVRTDPVLVIRVIPALADSHRSDFRCVSVGHPVTVQSGLVNSGLVISHLIFSDGVSDFLTMIVVLRQVAEGHAPVITFAHGFGIVQLAIGQQVDGHAVRTHTVLIIRVIPDLADGHVNGLGFVAVGDRVVFDIGRVIFHILFRHGILDLITLIAVLQQPFEFHSPVIAFIGLQRSGFDAVRKQVDGHGIRTFSILVVIIIPHLDSGHFRGFRCMAVGKRGQQAVDGHAGLLITCRQGIFGPAVVDHLTARVDRDLDRGFPAVSFVQRHLISVGQEHLQFIRTQPVTVIIIVPDFLHYERLHFRLIAVGHGRYGIVFLG